VTRLRPHLPAGLHDKVVPLLTSRDLRKWRDGLAKTLAPATVNRTCAAFKAALNLVADHDERIVSRRAWEAGLATIPDAEQSRNVVLPEAKIRQIIAEAHKLSAEFGVLVEVAAVTGARVSQLARIEVQDLQPNRADPRLMMPTSRKGKGSKKMMRRPVPISVGLAARLQVLTINRAAAAPLLVKQSGEPWKKSDHSRPFRRAATAAGQDPSEVTMYALRHSNIVRQILAGVPIRVVAVNYDTSIAMLERTYSRHIGDHSDALARGALLDTADTVDANVLPLRA
jgi:integrase